MTATPSSNMPVADAIGINPKSETRTGDRFVGLDAYRGIAALIIVCYNFYQHTGNAWMHLYVGNPLHTILPDLNDVFALFFVLSGFINFLPFARAALDQQGSYSVRGFLVRRGLRTIPLYSIVVLVVWTSRYFGSPEQWVDLIEHLTFTQIFDQRHIFWTIGPAWSLSVEFWFYCVVACFGPITYHVCSVFNTKKVRTLVLISLRVALMILSLTYKLCAVYVAHIPLNNYPVYFSFFALLDTCALGMFLAVLVAVGGKLTETRKYVPVLLRVIAIALIVAACYYCNAHNTDPLQYITFQTAWSVAMLLVISATVIGPLDSLWERCLSSRPLQYLGLLSYSIFLWNEPLLIGLGHYLMFTSELRFSLSILTLIILTLITSTASYWLLEYPLSQLKHLFMRDGRLRPRYT